MIRATPTAYGKDAEKIQREIAEGTPDTPERIARIREADALYARLRLSRETPAKREPEKVPA
jgi:hypothetical protein